MWEVNRLGWPPTRGYAFVANLSGALDVLADHDSTPHLIHKIGLGGGEPVGVTLTADGRYLLMADGGDGAYVVNVARAEAGVKGALLGTLTAGKSGRLGGGAIEVAASRDGRYAFVLLEDSGKIAVYRLAAAITGRFAKSTYVGAIPNGPGAGWAGRLPRRALALLNQRDCRRTRPAWVGRGRLAQRDQREYRQRDPARSVVATTSAGCNPVRVAVSSNGQDVWVTARESDELLAFSASKLAAHAKQAELAKVRVGEAPVGLALVDHDTRVIVADSNRFDAAGRDSSSRWSARRPRWRTARP